MNNIQNLVSEFNEKFEHPVGNVVNLQKSKDFWRRINWLLEEVDELIEAFDNSDLYSFARELGDVAYILYGFAVECNIPMDEVIKSIHKANMTKFGSDGKPIYEEDGKVAKGPNYVPPTEEIKEILRGHSFKAQAKRQSLLDN